MANPKTGTWQMEPILVEILHAHSNAGIKKSYRKNEALYEQGEISSKFYFIKTGMVQVSIIKSDGTEIILEFMGENTICGEGSAFDLLPRFSSGFAIEPTEAIEFDTTQLHDIFKSNPEFATMLLGVISIKQRILAIRLEQLSSRDPEGRILELFRRLGAICAEEVEEGRLIIPRLTHEQIAAMTGNTRVTVTRSLTKLRNQSVINLHDGRILLPHESLVFTTDLIRKP